MELLKNKLFKRLASFIQILSFHQCSFEFSQNFKFISQKNYANFEAYDQHLFTKSFVNRNEPNA